MCTLHFSYAGQLPILTFSSLKSKCRLKRKIASTTRYQILTHLHFPNTPGRSPVPLPPLLSLGWALLTWMTDPRAEENALRSLPSAAGPHVQCHSLAARFPAKFLPQCQLPSQYCPVSFCLSPNPHCEGPGEMTLWLPSILLSFYFVPSYLNSCSLEMSQHL